MPFKKGEISNPKGRPKGKGNNTTEAVKAMVTELVSKGMDQALIKLNEIEDPDKYLNTLSKYIQFVLPKNIDLNTDITINKGPKRIGFED